LFLSHFDVHVQLDAQQELIDKYLAKEKDDRYPSNAVYAAMIENVDNSVGRIEAKLNELGLSENTVVIFFSDNGGLVSRFDKVPLHAKSKLHIYQSDTLQYIASSNAPLRAEKGTVYEGGIREPLIVKWPGKVASGSLNHSVITSVDFYPTFLEMADVAPDPNQIFDGESLVNIITNSTENYDRPIYWHYPVYHHAVPASVIRKGDYKLIENLVDGSIELYNVADDIEEAHNLAESRPDRTGELYGLLKEWQQEVQAEFPVPNPDFDPERRYEWGRHPDRK